jgi:hypothetical protein
MAKTSATNCDFPFIRPKRISPHPETILPHPRGEIQTISPHHDTRTGEPQTTCAGEVGRNSPNFAPREKEKNFAGAKISQTSRGPQRRRSEAEACFWTKPRVLNAIPFAYNDLRLPLGEASREEMPTQNFANDVSDCLQRAGPDHENRYRKSPKRQSKTYRNIAARHLVLARIWPRWNAGAPAEFV